MKIGDYITINEGRKLWKIIDIKENSLWVKRGRRVKIIPKQGDNYAYSV